MEAVRWPLASVYTHRRSSDRRNHDEDMYTYHRVIPGANQGIGYDLLGVQVEETYTVTVEQAGGPRCTSHRCGINSDVRPTISRVPRCETDHNSTILNHHHTNGTTRPQAYSWT